jgi:hypothetical protein
MDGAQAAVPPISKKRRLDGWLVGQGFRGGEGVLRVRHLLYL